MRIKERERERKKKEKKEKKVDNKTIVSRLNNVIKTVNSVNCNEQIEFSLGLWVRFK